MRSRESSATENFSTKIAHGFYDAEVNNGGHHQYFWNSRGYFVDLVEKGLDYYRAKEQLAIFREAMSRDDPSPEKESTEPASSPPVEFSWEAIERVARRLGKELLKVSQARFKTADGATRFVGLASPRKLTCATAALVTGMGSNLRKRPFLRPARIHGSHWKARGNETSF